MFVVSRAVSFGRRAALLTVAGNAAGAYAQVLLVAVGIGAIVERSIAVFTAVKFLGALYLIWLGVQTFRHRREASQIDTALVIARSNRSLVTDGFVVGASNPKTIVFFAAILPQFVEPGGAPEALQMAVLGLVFVAVALVSDSVWGLGAGTARQWFVQVAAAARGAQRCRRCGDRRPRHSPRAAPPGRLTGDRVAVQGMRSPKLIPRSRAVRIVSQSSGTLFIRFVASSSGT